MCDSEEAWLDRLATLNVATSARTGPAPHKPLLMLTVLDMIEDGSLATSSIALSPELLFRFQSYCSIVMDRRSAIPDLRMPFHALGSRRDRIWTVHAADGTPSEARATTRLVRMNAKLWDLAHDAAFRRLARERLVATYFEPRERIALAARLDLPRFRSAVLVNYQFRCALTGYRLTTESDHMVEAAHIHAHAESGNDDPSNGMALTPDSHWAFDRGLWTAQPAGPAEFVVLVARSKFEESPLGHTLKAREGQPLHIPTDVARRPNPRFFAWHRTHRFGK